MIVKWWHDSRAVVRHIWRHPANQSARARQLARALLFQARGRILRRATVVAIGHHSRILAELHRSGASKAVYANPPDIEMRVWQKCLSPGDLFIDVGANVGTYSILAAEHGAKVIAIEPDPEAADRLRGNAALNGYEIEVIECAMGATSGTASFTVGLDTVNCFAPESGCEGLTERTRRVSVRRLDDIIGSRHVRGVKIDVEGAEHLVLNGAKSALSEGRIELVQFEWTNAPSARSHPRQREAALLDESGYHLWRDDGEGGLVRLDDWAHPRDVFARHF